ncbi:hypothetical protein NMY22_g13457 [Coprinellus aureogranulatus]|nr:hypothetical protein NMY22_g13457 [Coprinellus aureogranulatus]
MPANVRFQILRRALKEEDLERYLTFYAHRIKLVSPSLMGSADMPSMELLHAFQLATGYKRGALSPSLKQFNWLFIEDSFAPFMSLFLGPQIQALAVGDPDTSGDLSIASIYYYTRGLPHLKELIMSGKNQDAWRFNYIMSYSWDCLQDIHLSFLSSRVLRHLSTLPRLQRIEICYYEGSAEDFGMEPPSPQDQHFPSLRELDLDFDRIDHLEYFLKYLPLDNQVHTMQCTLWKPSSPSSYQSAIDTIGRICNPHSLKHFSLREDSKDYPDLFWPEEDEEDEEDEDEEDGDGDLNMDVDLGKPVNLTTLCSFPLLETLTVWLSKPLQLGPQDIERMGTAWPNMHRLDLCASFPSFGRLPAIDHTHLLSLLRGCPSIRYLGLRFDATRIGETDDDGTFLLRTLRVGGSPICSPSRVVGFIRKHFPKLEELDDTPVDEVDDARFTMLEKRWGTVRRELRLESLPSELSYVIF